MKKKNYPKSVKVKNSNYRIEWAEIIEETEEEYIRGECHTGRDKHIKLLSTLNDQEAFSTFWHEILHAFEEEYKIKLAHKKVVYALEGPLSKFLLDNFKLTRRNK